MRYYCLAIAVVSCALLGADKNRLPSRLILNYNEPDLQNIDNNMQRISRGQQRADTMASN